MKTEEEKINEQIAPFNWIDREKGASVWLNVGSYKTEIFESRTEEGFIGNGYDWGSLAEVFLREKKPELSNKIGFDPEADTYVIYSSDKAALQEFAIAFKQACEDTELIMDLFSRAELD